MPVLDAFRIKPFDLEPVYAAWPVSTGPRFLGSPKKDLPVDEWLKAIKTGCLQHHVPREYWHTCAQHFMGDQARARFSELKKVMAQMHGGKYRWNWKKFKVAMRNMSWDIDISETETVKVPSGPFWWLPGRSKTKSESECGSSQSMILDSEEAVLVEEPEALPSLSRSGTFMSLKSERPGPSRSSTMSAFWPRRRDSKDVDEGEQQSALTQRPAPRQAKSDGAIVAKASTLQVASTKDLPPIPTTVATKDGNTVRAPAWLLNATHALDFLQNEHPKVMTTISAILIVAGSIPSLPGIAAGAGGAVLASSTAHAVGAIAVGIGSWMKTQQEVHDAKQGGKQTT
ncbi:hypothetical protein MIND_00441800 [Mycena indigotica]|uniref:Uncharacterized protein n=1 Tax=Mycena indigotica TaxID=2126181 RepID=A0A8H6SZ13_9AGAR|nr:uncharacterized protein MIND_00441800 [Mycena indigotica]KAF7306505.1 hypothetical protein MIND_00441800 [Mycena indigotica]